MFSATVIMSFFSTICLFYLNTVYSFKTLHSSVLPKARRLGGHSFPLSFPICVVNEEVTPLMKTYAPELTSDMLISMLSVSLLLLIATGFWWSTIIPQQRKKLALSKTRGEVKEYLEDLRSERSSEGTAGKSQRGFERWLFADWLKRDNVAKPAAIPFIKKVKWNSGDNPVLVAFGGIMALVIAASIGERF